MTIDNNGQGIIDFSEVFSGKDRRRRRLKASESVPPERIKVLAEVRQACGIMHKDIAANSDFSVNVVSNILNLHQRVSLEDYERLKSALTDVVFRKILASVNGGRRP